MRTTLLCCFCLLTGLRALALHGKGGVLTYEYLGPGSAPNTSKYKVTAKEYFDCHGTQFILAPIYMSVYDAGTNTLYKTYTIERASQIEVKKTSFGCINPAPEVCFVIADFIIEIELPDNTNGYVLVEQECCRIPNLVNIQNSSAYGMSNYNIIPGVINNTPYRTNSSPVFAQKDTSVICYNSYFSLDMSTTDKDGDSLSYAFCSAKASSGQTRQPNPALPPPYNDLPYNNGFSAGQPLGDKVTINPKTGLISGIAPGTTGSYIISVCVSEYRKGVLIGTTKKEVQVEVAKCTTASASLKTEYINCDDGTFTFKTEFSSSNIAAYFWDFGVPGITTDTSSAVTPTFTYQDTGVYQLKLRVTSATGCQDSASAPVSVFPGFDPGFEIKDSCFRETFAITDTTRAAYGSVNSWKWTFGDNSSPATAQHPTHKYTQAGTYTIKLVTTSTKGCTDSASHTLTVYDAPTLSLPFRDTLICNIDTLAIPATGNGSFIWTPDSRILNAQTPTPLVFPLDTTSYTATVNYHGCLIKDSVRVAVLPFITVDILSDTAICRSDSIRLNPISHALQWQWTPATGLSNPQIKNPMAAPATDITYHVIANLGKCQDDAYIRVKVAPYPEANAGADTTVCYNDTAQLSANIVASSFTWSPVATLQNAHTLNPLAHPLRTTAYVLTVRDTLGCPKPVRDTVVVQVLPRIPAFAGNDTAVIVGQPLQLQASGGTLYAWLPATGLNNPSIADPVAILSGAYDSIAYVVKVSREDGCSAYDTVVVKIFRTDPDIFVPSAFSPNGDGRNDMLKPILVGMKSLESFRVYNRWGQLVFSTSQAGKGWDGRLKGLPQKSDVYVYLATGINYLGKKVERKGTAMLIR
jgi:gliding motility-associated-like protein